MDKTTPAPQATPPEDDRPIDFSDFVDHPKKRGGILNILTMQAILCTLVMIAFALLGLVSPATMERCRRGYQKLVTADNAKFVETISKVYDRVFAAPEGESPSASNADTPSAASIPTTEQRAPAASSEITQTVSLPTVDLTPSAGVLNLMSAPAGTSLLPVKATIAFTPPLQSATVSSLFGQRVSPITGKLEFHKALDLAAAAKTPVRAAADGKVLESGRSETLGNYVYLQHADGFTSKYGHLSSRAVRANATVRAGQVIGRVGSTGQSTGYHLHLEMRKNGVAFNPLYLFSYA